MLRQGPVSPDQGAPGHVHGLGDLPPVPTLGPKPVNSLKVHISPGPAHTALPLLVLPVAFNTGQASSYPVPDQLLLEPREAGDEVDQQAPGGQVDGFHQADDTAPAGREVIEEQQEIAEAATEAVERGARAWTPWSRCGPGR